MKKKGNVLIGTSGWHYKHWKGPFYPAGIPDDQLLTFYADKFRTVEINNTFYRLPEEDTLRQWGDATPEGFVFAVKAGRYLTHMKKLKDAGPPLLTFLDTMSLLGKKLGPLLFQLPPNWRFDAERMRSFCGALPATCRYAFEFRDRSWLNPQVYEILSGCGAAFCIYDFDGFRSPKAVTADFVYVRLHGPDGPYKGRYKENDLAGWAADISQWRSQGKEIYCYFDNDERGLAPNDALRLERLVRDRG